MGGWGEKGSIIRALREKPTLFRRRLLGRMAARPHTVKDRHTHTHTHTTQTHFAAPCVTLSTARRRSWAKERDETKEEGDGTEEEGDETEEEGDGTGEEGDETEEESI